MGAITAAVKAVIHLGGTGTWRTPRDRDVVYSSPWWDEVTTSVGKSITPEKAMAYVPFFAGVRLISESTGRLPLILYRRTGEDDRERARGKQLYRILHDEPNPEMSAMVWKETMQGHIVTRGNAYSERVRDDLGRDAQLWPLRPDRMTVLRDTETGEKFYRYRIESRGDEVDLRRDQVLHIPGFGYDGYVGYSVVSLFRDHLALGLAAQEFGARFFRSGGAPSAVVQHPKGWSKDELDRLSASIRQNYGGLTNAQRIAILEEGVTWQSIGMSLDDAQFLETRKHQRGETATMLNIPPHMLQDVERTTSWGTGIEEQTLGFVTFSQGAHLDRFASEINRQLVRPAYGDSHYAEFLVDAYLKGRALDRWKVYQLARHLGVINADYIAKKENMPVPEDGSGISYWRPSNLTVATDPEEEPEPQAPPMNGNGSSEFPIAELETVAEAR